MGENDGVTTPDQGSATPQETQPPTNDELAGGINLDAAGTTTPASESFIPAEFKDRGWAKSFEGKDINEFFKSYDNAQSTIGRLNNEFRIPGENASPDQIAQFKKAMGVPDTPDAYEPPQIEWKPEELPSAEFLKQTRNAEFESDIKKLFQEVGLTPKQAKQLWEGYDRNFVKHQSKALDERAKAMTEITEDFSREAELLWGDKTDQVLDDVKRIVEQYADKSRPHLVDMPNKYLLMMGETIYGLARNLMSEDKFRAAYPVRASGDNSSRAGLEAQARALMGDPEYLRNPSSPKGKEIQKEIDRLIGEAVKFKS